MPGRRGQGRDIKIHSDGRKERVEELADWIWILKDSKSLMAFQACHSFQGNCAGSFLSCWPCRHLISIAYVSDATRSLMIKFYALKWLTTTNLFYLSHPASSLWVRLFCSLHLSLQLVKKTFMRAPEWLWYLGFMKRLLWVSSCFLFCIYLFISPLQYLDVWGILHALPMFADGCCLLSEPWASLIWHWALGLFFNSPFASSSEAPRFSSLCSFLN